jgi:ketosteroid isomerase-like protein
MAREHLLEAIANGYAAFNARDAETIVAWLDEDIEYRLPLDPMRRYPAYRGHDGVREFYRTLWENFAEFHAEVVSTNHVGDVVVAVGHYRIRRAPGDEALRAAFAHFWKVAGDRVVQVSFHDAVNPLALLEDGGEPRVLRARRRVRGDHVPSAARSTDQRAQG